jgi:hypothetical protein
MIGGTCYRDGAYCRLGWENVSLGADSSKELAVARYPGRFLPAVHRYSWKYSGWR